jgi:flagellar basal-body rod modification protein FlgD
MSIASDVAQQAVSSSASQTASTSSSNNALSSLSSNFGDFLNLLMTQLQNQDPTSPMDTNQFTSQLVQFASVEQQITANASLTQLIQLTQAGELMQSSAMMGKQVTVQSDHMPLQDGSGNLTFTAPAAEPVVITISTDSGTKIKEVSLDAAAGANSWTWDGTNSAGQQVPDGSYKVSVMGGPAGSTPSALPFTVTGTATGVQNQNNSTQLQLGALSVDFGRVVSVGK